ncbi:hypothetical protein LCGC14_1757480 [marine sediment metagenome]|uniref:Uncharacterized protein n=1 Tax=marine sediment metagenome TaxID=412755 RepID=A0A0F9K1M7_9ZZZZ
MKDFIRYRLQDFLQWGSRTRGRSAICFPFLNHNMLDIIHNLSKNKHPYAIKFLPRVKDRYFENRYLTFEHLNEKKELFDEYSMQIEQFFIDNKVKYYVLDRLTNDDLYLHAAIMGAKTSPNTEIVYLDHGESGQYNLPYEIYWTSFTDYYYVGNTDMRGYVEKVAKSLNSSSKIREWKRRLPEKKETRKGLLLFAPAFHELGTLGSSYSDVLKYQVRKHMLFALEKLADTHKLKVIWKYMKGEEGFDAVPEIIKNYKLKNIRYELRNNFNFWLSRAEFFVADCVSTTFYDAMDMGVKSLALWPSILMDIRPDVLKRFGESIYIYDSIDQAIKQLQYFLDQKFWYQVKVPYSPDLFPWEEDEK